MITKTLVDISDLKEILNELIDAGWHWPNEIIIKLCEMICRDNKIEPEDVYAEARP